ncbi:hypothetical protein OTU49_009342 [Cherax quadricarinatus]|uniref:Uncharacterized protein n=1 Tax=Cherax quadricarinatus TaxID=27406 RepID=A0AAW0Y4Q1_CHEQU
MAQPEVSQNPLAVFSLSAVSPSLLVVSPQQLTVTPPLPAVSPPPLLALSPPPLLALSPQQLTVTPPLPAVIPPLPAVSPPPLLAFSPRQLMVTSPLPTIFPPPPLQQQQQQWQSQDMPFLQQQQWQSQDIPFLQHYQQKQQQTQDMPFLQQNQQQPQWQSQKTSFLQQQKQWQLCHIAEKPQQCKKMMHYQHHQDSQIAGLLEITLDQRKPQVAISQATPHDVQQLYETSHIELHSKMPDTSFQHSTMPQNGKIWPDKSLQYQMCSEQAHTASQKDRSKSEAILKEKINFRPIINSQNVEYTSESINMCQARLQQDKKNITCINFMCNSKENLPQHASLQEVGDECLNGRNPELHSLKEITASNVFIGDTAIDRLEEECTVQVNVPVPDDSNLKMHHIVSSVSSVHRNDNGNDASHENLKTSKPQDILCYTCNTRVLQENLTDHLLFGKLKCCNCSVIITNCSELEQIKKYTPPCMNKIYMYGQHNLSHWLACPFAYIKYFIIKNIIDFEFCERDESRQNCTDYALAISNYLKSLRTLEDVPPWKQAIEKCRWYLDFSFVPLGNFKNTTAGTSKIKKNSAKQHSKKYYIKASRSCQSKKREKKSIAKQGQQYKNNIGKQNGMTDELRKMSNNEYEENQSKKLSKIIGVKISREANDVAQGGTGFKQDTWKSELLFQRKPCEPVMILPNEAYRKKMLSQEASNPEKVSEDEVGDLGETLQNEVGKSKDLLWEPCQSKQLEVCPSETKSHCGFSKLEAVSKLESGCLEVTSPDETVQLDGNSCFINPIQTSDNENVSGMSSVLSPATARKQDDSSINGTSSLSCNQLNVTTTNEYNIMENDNSSLKVEIRKSSSLDQNTFRRAGSHQTWLELDNLQVEWIQGANEAATVKVMTSDEESSPEVMSNEESSPEDKVRTRDMEPKNRCGGASTGSRSKVILLPRHVWNPSVIDNIQLPMDTVEDSRYLVVRYPEEMCPEECPECYCSFCASMLTFLSNKRIFTLICPDCSLTIFILPAKSITKNLKLM